MVWKTVKSFSLTPSFLSRSIEPDNHTPVPLKDEIWPILGLLCLLGILYLLHTYWEKKTEAKRKIREKKYAEKRAKKWRAYITQFMKEEKKCT